MNQGNERPSDLEIVQKALIKSGCCLRSNNFGFDVFIYYHQDGLEFIKEMISLTDLLTWAKQTVGYDRCQSHDSEQSNNWISDEANKAKEQTKDWPEWKKDSVINSDAYAINQQTEWE